jgi:cytochrome P450
MSIFQLTWNRRLFDLFPTITAPKAYLARGRLQTALGEYYSELGDRDKEAAGITNHRAEVLRENSIKGATVGDLELSFLHVATSNTIPTLFWFFSFIATRPELVSRLRDEALAMVDYGSGESIVIKVHEIAGKCPLLVSCYRETIRLTNKTQSNRRVMTDTKLEDDKGNSFLLKEGVNVQMPSGHLHAMEEIWGPDAAQFNPQRFFEFNKDSTKRNLKARRMSYIPFGGGKHLCPGRHFAFAENLGFMITLLLGFDVLPINADWSVFKEPEQEKCSLAAAVCKPKDGGRGFGMRLKKRAGWESAQWMYVSKTI